MPNALDPKYEYEVAAAVYPDPMALYELDPDWKPTFFYHHRVTIAVFLAVGLTRISTNWMKNRPVYSGIQRTALWFLCGGIIGEIAQRGVDKYIDFRSQVHRHYIQLHPERFPAPKKQKIGDIYELWIPSRQ